MTCPRRVGDRGWNALGVVSGEPGAQEVEGVGGVAVGAGGTDGLAAVAAGGEDGSGALEEDGAVAVEHGGGAAQVDGCGAAAGGVDLRPPGREVRGAQASRHEIEGVVVGVDHRATSVVGQS
jgi:hypothetical protein